MSNKALEKEYKKMRQNYKPKKIRCLLIAESPPAPDEEEKKEFYRKPEKNPLRFFYNPDKYKYDFLFDAIMEVIFPAFKNLTKVQKEKYKGQYLDGFKTEGFYLIDAVDYPINDIENLKERNTIIENNLSNKITEIKSLIDKNTPIILIKANIYKIFEKPLKKQSLNVINDDKLPFPSNGNQNDFKEMFKEYLQKI